MELRAIGGLFHTAGEIQHMGTFMPHKIPHTTKKSVLPGRNIASKHRFGVQLFIAHTSLAILGILSTSLSPDAAVDLSSIGHRPH